MDFWNWGGPGVLMALLAGAVLVWLFQPRRPAPRKRRTGRRNTDGTTAVDSGSSSGSGSKRSGEHSTDTDASGFSDGASGGGDGGGGGGGD